MKIRKFYRKPHFVNSAEFVPLGRKYCRFAALPRRPLEGPNRNFCRKVRFAESAVKVPEMRFHVLDCFANPLIFNDISDKGRLPTRSDLMQPSLSAYKVHQVLGLHR